MTERSTICPEAIKIARNRRGERKSDVFSRSSFPLPPQEKDEFYSTELKGCMDRPVNVSCRVIVTINVRKSEA